MSVVNVKVSKLRPKYKNLKEWMKHPDHVYIGRANVVFIDGARFPHETSIWANPFKIGKDGNRDQVIDKYEKYMKEFLQDRELRKNLMELKGKVLGCWCSPARCHGDVLLKLIPEFDYDSDDTLGCDDTISYDDDNITTICGIVGCDRDYEKYSPCCHEPLCKQHYKCYECENCDVIYCFMCAEINGYICKKCDKFFCDNHNIHHVC